MSELYNIRRCSSCKRLLIYNDRFGLETGVCKVVGFCFSFANSKFYFLGTLGQFCKQKYGIASLPENPSSFPSFF